MIDYIKPSKEERRDYTFSKEQKVNLLEKIRGLGIPILKYVSKDKTFLPDREIYSQEHLLDWMLTTIINQQIEIDNLKA